MFAEKQIVKQEASPEARAYIAKLVAEMEARIASGEEEDCVVTVFNSPAVEARVEDWASFSL